jgi:hypothetical protein
MSNWLRAKQWLYPPEFRIHAGSSDAQALSVLADVVTRLLAQAERAAPSAPPADAGNGTPASDAGPVAAPVPGGLDKSFVIDLCNSVHRLSRAAKPLLESGGSDGGRVQRNFDLLRKALQTRGIEAVDLSGQVFSPDRYDFEPLGEPQPTEGLTRMTIVQCDRPLVMLDGKMLQPAKGIVGRPAGSGQAAVV